MGQLDGARSSGSSSAENENLRGLALMLAGDAAKGLAAFDRALELDPNLAEARFNRAVALLKLNDPAAASAEFARIAGDDRPSLRASAAYHNALALDRLKRREEAQKWLTRALELDPRLDAALLYSGVLHERAGNLQAAGRAYSEYLKRNPDSTVAMLRFGISAHRAGFADTARGYLRRVLDRAPDSPEAVEARKFLVMWE
jgi:tetratricopeptide (TPR) repeat protein